MNTFAASMFAAGTFGCAVSFGVAGADAGTYGNAPWCAVQNLGFGDIVWDCQYRSAEECQPQVIAGNRGFCNLNPYFVAPAYGPAAARHRKRSQM